ncbi:MAG: hypothetical protein JXB30_06505 [Anaerolineae bacterium]|nr:hypothetical protein [Anaerolineae bacterium]
MHRYLPAIAWTLALYMGTALTAGQAFIPATAQNATPEQIKQAWLWFELKHVILHAAAYSVLVWLLAWPYGGDWKKKRRRFLVNLLTAILLIGLGQEAVQSIVRWQIRLTNSLVDLASNTGGAAMTLAMITANRWRHTISR